MEQIICLRWVNTSNIFILQVIKNIGKIEEFEEDTNSLPYQITTKIKHIPFTYSKLSVVKLPVLSLLYDRKLWM